VAGAEADQPGDGGVLTLARDLAGDLVQQGMLGGRWLSPRGRRGGGCGGKGRKQGREQSAHKELLRVAANLRRLLNAAQEPAQRGL
jgi:hypothetical protein